MRLIYFDIPVIQYAMENNTNKKISVLHVISAPGIGGIERLVLDLAKSQENSALIDPSILFSLYKKSAGFKSAYIDSGIPIFSGNLRGGFDFLPWKIINIYHIVKDYQLIHIHTFNFVVIIAAILLKKKIVFTDHGTHGIGRKIKLRDRVKLVIQKLVLNNCVAGVSFISKYIESASKKRFGLEGVKTELIYNGISKSYSFEKIPPIDEECEKKLVGKFVVGSSSRFSGFKRLDRLIDGFNLFQKNKDAVLLLVGDGVEKQRLQDLVKKHNITEKVIFTGYQTNVQAYQNAMHVCVFPSLGEPFGLVSIEALTLGKPVIVFNDGGGITEIINGHSKNDVVSGKNSLARRLQYYYENINLITSASQSRKDYAAQFCIQTMEEKFSKFYMEVMACVG